MWHKSKPIFETHFGSFSPRGTGRDYACEGAQSLIPSRLLKNSRMCASPWKSGPSGPRKALGMSAGFSPWGRLFSAKRVIPQPPSVVSLKFAASVETLLKGAPSGAPRDATEMTGL